MKLKILVAAMVLAATATAPLSASAQDALTGDTKLACEAILCLASPTRPQECAAAIAKYFSIDLKRFAKSMQARKKFLSLCPRVDSGIVEHVAINNPPPPDPPEPDPSTPGHGGPMDKAQVIARIAVLTPIWESVVVISLAARDVVEKCVARLGRVQDGFCAAEMADYNAKRQPAVILFEEIERLKTLLRNFG